MKELGLRKWIFVRVSEGKSVIEPWFFFVLFFLIFGSKQNWWWGVPKMECSRFMVMCQWLENFDISFDFFDKIARLNNHMK
jgi:hypothetical protein